MVQGMREGERSRGKADRKWEAGCEVEWDGI